MAVSGNLYELVDTALQFALETKIDTFDLTMKRYTGDDILGVTKEMPEDGIDGCELWVFNLEKDGKRLVIEFIVADDGLIREVFVTRNTLVYGSKYHLLFDILTAVEKVEKMPESLVAMVTA